MFNDWLLNRLKELDMSQADLSRSSGLTTGAISNYINGRIPDKVALRKIAKGLNISPLIVFQAAGALPDSTDDPWVADMEYKISQLTGARREMAERLLNTLLAEQDREEHSQAKPVLK
jgi:transcriptional regulator with XRE-family HTH domain